MGLVVPFQVEALPAALEERVETDIVVLFGTLDVAGVVQVQRLAADGLPVVDQNLQFGEGLRCQVGAVRYLREQVHQAVDRSEEAGVVAQLARQLVAYPAAKMDIEDAQRIGRQDENFHECKVVGAKRRIYSCSQCLSMLPDANSPALRSFFRNPGLERNAQ